MALSTHITTSLTALEMQYLTRILRYLPDEDPNVYTNRTTSLLASSRLPSRLKRPHPRSSHLSILFNSARSQLLTRPSATTPLPPSLCTLHSPLNASTIHSLFARLVAEVGRNLDSLVLHRERLNASQRGVLRRLRKSGLKLKDYDGQETFCSRSRSATGSMPCQADGCGSGRVRRRACEACLLALVGGDQEILLDLRTVLLSRKKTPARHRHGGEKVPTLLVFVEAWLQRLLGLGFRLGDGVREGLDVLERNRCEAQTLKEVRKGIWRERETKMERYRGRGRSGALELESGLEREIGVQTSRVMEVSEVPDLDAAVATAATAADGCGGGRGGRDGSSDSDSESDSGSDPDVEIEIINYYATQTSTLHLPSLAGGSKSETTAAIGTQRSGLSSTTYADDVASGHGNCHGQGHGHKKRSAEEQARSYQDLLATSSSSSLRAEVRSEWDDNSVSEEGEETSRVGRKWWSRVGLLEEDQGENDVRLGMLGEYVGFATTRTASTWKIGEPKVGRTLILTLLRLGRQSRRQDTATAATALALLKRYMVVGGGDNDL